MNTILFDKQAHHSEVAASSHDLETETHLCILISTHHCTMLQVTHQRFRSVFAQEKQDQLEPTSLSQKPAALGVAGDGAVVERRVALIVCDVKHSAVRRQ